MARRALPLLLALLLPATQAQAQAPAPSTPPLQAAPPDLQVELTDEDDILLGTPGRKVTPLELFEALGRQDLADQARANRARRTGLFIAAGALAAGALAAGIALWATAPEMGGSSRCNSGDLAYYNSYCEPQWVLHTQAGTISLVAGLAAAGALAAIGFWIRPDVFTSFELQEFIHRRNASLPQVQVTPWLSPSGGGLAARATF